MVTSQPSTNGRDIFYILAVRFPDLVMRNATLLADWLKADDRSYFPFDRYDVDRLGAITNLSTTETRVAILNAMERVSARRSPKS